MPSDSTRTEQAPAIPGQARRQRRTILLVEQEALWTTVALLAAHAARDPELRHATPSGVCEEILAGLPAGADLPKELHAAGKVLAEIGEAIRDIATAAIAVEVDLTYGTPPHPTEYEILPLPVLDWVKARAAERRKTVRNGRASYPPRDAAPLAILGQGEYARRIPASALPLPDSQIGGGL